ncbi:MAG TPA: DegT/DnrJ/EryC1/StrS family aminotransferase [Flavobacteriales bacterium]|nr:DegT/DnrJ/EryC1/StrS family aminotransferase [Flavobacteriales bacterium]
MPAALVMALSPINVTRTFLPPMEEYTRLIAEAYSTHVLTNNGPLHRRLESALRDRLGAPHLLLMSNGTLAIQLAIRALGVTGKVITTPYSYVATTSALLWEGCEPVFVDVLKDTMCIDPSLIEAAITPGTTAILATHVYGVPCDVEAIDAIARKHGLKVIYDAAHAFDVRYKGRPITAYGDASTLSFHATKLFHTVEGGATIVHSEKAEHDTRLLRSFGHIHDEHFSLGMNAKLSEVHAAMGLALLPHMERIIADRKEVCAAYDAAFAGLPLRAIVMPRGTEWNYAYYPVLLQDGSERQRVFDHLAAEGIIARRYFYPSLNTLPYVTAGAMPVSEDLADRVLCLPLFAGMTDQERDRVCTAMVGAFSLARR